MLLSALKQTGTERITVILEDGTEIRSSLSVVAELRLYAGKELDNDQLGELQLLSRRSLARDRALELISRRPMSCRELEKKLLEKGESEDTAAYCVEWLTEHRFLDDEDYARRVVRHYAAKNYGEGRIRAELSRRFVPRDLWDDALSEISGADDKLDAFLASRLKHPEDQDEVRKVSNALFRRGYGWDQIRDALRRYSDSVSEEIL